MMNFAALPPNAMAALYKLRPGLVPRREESDSEGSDDDDEEEEEEEEEDFDARLSTLAAKKAAKTEAKAGTASTAARPSAVAEGDEEGDHQALAGGLPSKGERAITKEAFSKVWGLRASRTG